MTPTYRAQTATLQRCLDSTSRQTFTDFEHLVCSDGEEEPLARHLVHSYDHRFRYLYTGRPDLNHGNGVRRYLLEKASGEFIVFLDADNFLLPSYLEKMRRALEQDVRAGFAVCEILHYGPLLPAHGRPPVVLRGEFRLGYIDTLQVMSRVSAIRDVGWRGFEYAADAETYMALEKRYRFVRVPECLCVHC